MFFIPQPSRICDADGSPFHVTYRSPCLYICIVSSSSPSMIRMPLQTSFVVTPPHAYSVRTTDYVWSSRCLLMSITKYYVHLLQASWLLLCHLVRSQTPPHMYPLWRCIDIVVLYALMIVLHNLYCAIRLNNVIIKLLEIYIVDIKHYRRHHTLSLDSCRWADMSVQTSHLRVRHLHLHIASSSSSTTTS